MLVCRNRSLRLVFIFWPKPFRVDRPRKLVHSNAKIVQLAEMNIGADRTRFKTREQLLRLRLDDRQGKNQFKGLLSDGALPAVDGRLRCGH